MEVRNTISKLICFKNVFEKILRFLVVQNLKIAESSVSRSRINSLLLKFPRHFIHYYK